ncbi:iron-sulfur cluster assembly accessory protein [bacterium]|nr:iron-sulfur cluster assembly accessory protein [bacterium]
MITLTQSASDHIFEYIRERGKGIGIRVGIKTTGCSGLAYIIEPVDEKQKWDNIFQDKGIDIFIDKKSLVYVKGSEIDYIKKGLNTGLEFNNPNVQGACGCGESFTV